MFIVGKKKALAGSGLMLTLILTGATTRPFNRNQNAFFFFNDTATTEIYTLSLHDALPALLELPSGPSSHARTSSASPTVRISSSRADRKSTRLNSSHVAISYAVFCLK